MKLNKYQEKAMETCLPSSDNFTYQMLNLVGEIGEFASKVAKGIRKEQLSIKNNQLRKPNPFAINNPVGDIGKELKYEAGDILWQLAGLCKVMGWSLEEVAQMNLDKLASRKDRGKILGDGDDR